MKTSLPILIVMLSFFIVTCKDQSPTDPIQNKTHSGLSGSVMMKVDNLSIPVGVSKITATLTRSSFDPLTTTITSFTEDSAQIAFASVPVGTWHLKVDALNASNSVLYTGQTDVVISENTTTQVYLMLSPVQTGTGNIVITIGWGSTGLTWIDYTGNPIMQEFPQDINSSGPVYPYVLYENNVYKMWYTVIQASGNSIAYATSSDGIAWTRYGTGLALTRGNDSTWEGHGIGGSIVVHDGSLYKMYYNADNNTQYASYSCQVGLAISIDGINWIKLESPILSPTPDSWEGSSIFISSVVKTNDGYSMYYTAGEGAVGLALSSDGIQWTKYSGNPIMDMANGWGGDLGITYPSVIYDQGLFKMVYMNRKSTASLETFGYATSIDGKTWTKNNAEFFTSSITSNNWTTGINYPCFNKFGSQYRIYYNGYGSYGTGNWGIGLLQQN